MTFMIKAET